MGGLNAAFPSTTILVMDIISFDIFSHPNKSYKKR